MATGSRTPWVRQQFFDDNGNPLSGGLIDTYIAGSTTPINTYTDITLTTTHTNPIVLNTRGETTIFLDPTVAYKFVLRNPLPDGSEIWTQDNITALGGNSLLTDIGVISSKVVGSATLPVPLATNVVVPYDTTDYQVNLTGFNGAANKWVCPLDGIYNLNAAVDFTIDSNLAAPSATVQIFFLVNGVTPKNPKIWAFTTDANGGQKTLETSGTLQLTKNDEVKVLFIAPIQGSGTSIDLILGDAFWDIISLSGVKGNTGDQGPAGSAGVGVPVGGTANQVLAKIDATDYNTQWVNDTSSPSQGAQNVFNVADGSGGWTAFNSVSIPIFFRYDSVDGLIKNTGAPIYTDGAISSDNYVINNDTGQIIFAETGTSVSTTEMGRLQVSKDSLGTGLHRLSIEGFKQLYLGLVDLLIGGEIKFPALVDPGTDTNKTMIVVDSTSGVVQKRPLPTSGGSPSQGAAGIINIANGSGGWLAMDGSARPLFEWSSTTGNLSFTGGNFLISETIQATDKLEVINDSGEIRFRDTTDTITLARFEISKDALGSGLHELYLYNLKRFTTPNDFRVQGDVSFTGVVDPGTDTGKKMLVIDTATKTIQERPVPSSLDNTKLAILNNLSDLNSVSMARTNLGLGTAAVFNVGTSATSIVQLDAFAKLPAVDGSQLTNISATDNTKLAILNNLSDLNNSATARTNLGLGTAAVLNTGTGANNIVQLDGTSKLPAVDGSQLTNIGLQGLNSVLTEGNSSSQNISLTSGADLYVDGNLGIGTITPVEKIYVNSNSGDARIGLNAPTGSDTEIKFSNNGTVEYSMGHDDATDNFVIGTVNVDAPLVSINKTGKAVFNNDLEVSGDVTFDNTIDPGTDTGKKMLVIDTTSKQVEERPIPTGGGTPSALPIMVLTSNAADAGFGPSIGSLIVPWNIETYKDTGFSHSNTTNTTRAIVDNDGTYLIQGRLRIFNSVNQRAQPIVNILKNGVLLQGALDSSYIRNASGASDYWTLNFTYQPTKLLANDYIEVELNLDIGSTSSFNSSLLKAAESSLSIINLQGEKGEKGDQGTSTSVRVTSTNTTSSLTIDYDTTDQYNVTALAENITINNPGSSGPATDGFKLILRITPTGSHTITWNSNFRAIGVTLPTITTANKEIYVGCIRNSNNSSWDVVAVTEMV